MSLFCGKNAATDSLISVAVDTEGKIMTVSDAHAGTQDVNVMNASLDVADSAVASALAGTLSVADSAVATQLAGTIQVADSAVAIALESTLSVADSAVATQLAGTIQVADSAVASQLQTGLQTWSIKTFDESGIWTAESLPASSQDNNSGSFYPHGNGFVIGGNTTDTSGSVELSLQFSYDAVTWWDDLEAYIMVNGQGKFSYKQDESHAQYYRLKADNNSPSAQTITAAAMFHRDEQGVAPVP
jgi:hypothetical protein